MTSVGELADPQTPLLPRMRLKRHVNHRFGRTSCFKMIHGRTTQISQIARPRFFSVRHRAIRQIEILAIKRLHRSSVVDFGGKKTRWLVRHISAKSAVAAASPIRQ